MAMKQRQRYGAKVNNVSESKRQRNFQIVKNEVQELYLQIFISG